MSAAAQTPPPIDLVGIYVSETKIGSNPALKGLKNLTVTNEFVIYEDPDKPGALRTFVRTSDARGLLCLLEGDVSEAMSGSFTTSETLFGNQCSLKIVRNGDNLVIGERAGCAMHWCKAPSTFSTTPFRKICDVVEPSVREDLGMSLAVIDPDYGPSCSEPKR
jgi:hypothetical protein